MLTLRCNTARLSGVLAVPLLLLLANSAAAQTDARANPVAVPVAVARAGHPVAGYLPGR